MMKNMTASLPFRLLLLTMMIPLLLLTGCAEQKAKTIQPPEITASNVRGGYGGSSSLSVGLSHLPQDVLITQLKIEVKADSSDLTLNSGGLMPEWQRAASIDQELSDLENGIFVLKITDVIQGNSKPAIKIPVKLANNTSKHPIEINASFLIDGEQQPTVIESTIVNARSSRIYDPAALFAVLAAVVAIIYMLSTVKSLEGFFRYFPPLIWMYFIPMILTTIGITPDSSPLYSPFMSKIMLPAILVLLIIPSDIRTVVKLGPKAIAVMLVATLGITLGAIGSFSLFQFIMPDSLPEGTWQGIAALSGSWIGGSPNMTAVIESVGAPANIIGPLIIVDTVLAYSWLGVLVALSGYQHRIDKFNNASTQIVEELSERVRLDQEAHSRTPKPVDIAIMVGLAFGVSQICIALGPQIYNLIEAIFGEKNVIGEVVSGYGWAILLITAAGLFLSTTKVRHLDYCGASSIGYIGLYLLLTTYGARADLRSIFEVPVFFGMGLVWLIIHIVVLAIGLRLLKAPLFLGATSSMANIGGTASAPVVAASYYSTMAPVGLLMGIIGGTIGTPIAFAIAAACRMIAGE